MTNLVDWHHYSDLRQSSRHTDRGLARIVSAVLAKVRYGTKHLPHVPHDTDKKNLGYFDLSVH